jgi:dihydroflavonol-4-reductase
VEEKITIILIGAFGHVGRTLIPLLLEKGYAVRAFDFRLAEKQPTNPMLSFYRGDVSKPESLLPLFKGLEPHRFIVIHLAALIDIEAKKPTPAIEAVNVQGVKNVFNLFAERKGSRFLYVSSVDAFRQTHSLINEDAPLVEAKDKAAGYPISKAEATRFIKAKQKEGYDAVIVYPSGIIGPNDEGHNHLIQLLRDYLRGNLPGIIPSGYDVVDVRDLSSAIVSLLTKKPVRDSYLLSGHQVALKTLLLWAKEWNHGQGKRIVVFPYWVAYLGLPFVKTYCKIHRKKPLYTAFAISVVKHANSFNRSRAGLDLNYAPRDPKKSVFDSLDYLRLKGVV